MAANSVVRFDTDLNKAVYYSENARGTELLRMHYRIARNTARPGEFVVRHFRDATEADRADAVGLVGRMESIDRSFAKWKSLGFVGRGRWNQDRRSWIEFVYMGTIVDDPLVQLELDMMIENQLWVESGATS